VSILPGCVVDPASLPSGHTTGNVAVLFDGNPSWVTRIVTNCSSSGQAWLAVQATGRFAAIVSGARTFRGDPVRARAGSRARRPAPHAHPPG
jgi:membrane-associated phospholipid phosphatase